MSTDKALDLLVSIERYNGGSLSILPKEVIIQNYELLRDEALKHEIGKDEYADALVNLALNRIESLLIG